MPLKLSPTNTAFFICDIQPSLTNKVYYAEELVPTTAFLLNVARELEVPCVATEQYPEKLKPTIESLRILLEGTMDQKPYPVFSKLDFTMMTKEVKDYMTAQLPNVKNVVLCGMEAHICILQTCYDLLNEGYNVYVCVDATSSRSPIDRRVGLNLLQQAGVFLTTAESVAFHLLGSKSNPHFKAISALVLNKEFPNHLD